jgi:WD40 repeat protein
LAELAYFCPRTIVTRQGDDFPHPVRLWDPTSDTPPVRLTNEQAEVARAVFRPGGAEFLRRTGAWADGGLPDPTKAEAVLRLPVAFDRRLSVGGVGRVIAFAPDGEHMLYSQTVGPGGGNRTNVLLRDPAGELRPLHAGEAVVKTSGAFSPTGGRAATSCGTNRVGVWDLADRREVVAFEANDKVIRLAFVSEDRLVVAAGRSVGLWDATTGRLVKKGRAFRRAAETLAVSPDRTRFAAGSGDGAVRVWDAATGRELAEYDWGLNIVLMLAFSPDGTTAAAGNSKDIAVWDLD